MSGKRSKERMRNEGINMKREIKKLLVAESDVSQKIIGRGKNNKIKHK